MVKKGTAESSYNLREYLAFLGASVLEDEKSVFVGTGLPIIASMLAQKTHAPGLLILFEAGGIGPLLPELPISVGESRTFYKGIAASSMHDVMSLSQAGYADSHRTVSHRTGSRRGCSLTGDDSTRVRGNPYPKRRRTSPYSMSCIAVVAAMQDMA